MELRRKRSVKLREITRRLAWIAGTGPVTDFQIPKDLLQLNRTHNILLKKITVLYLCLLTGYCIILVTSEQTQLFLGLTKLR